MEEVLAAKIVKIKVCDNGTRYKVKDERESKDLLVARFYHSDPCGCCPSDSMVRFVIFDTNNRRLYSLNSMAVDDCCGCSAQMEAKIVGDGGVDLGELHGVPNAYSLRTVSGDMLYDLTSGFLTTTYKIVPKFNPRSEGKVSKEFTLLNLVSKLTFPDCSHELPDHKILLLMAALEITHRFYVDQQNQ